MTQENKYDGLVKMANSQGMLGLYSKEFKATIFTEPNKLIKQLGDMDIDTGSSYDKLGGKKGFMHYIFDLLKKEDNYFKTNKKKINNRNKRYQDFCDDLVLYEMIKCSIYKEPLTLIDLNNSEKSFTKMKQGLFQ